MPIHRLTPTRAPFVVASIILVGDLVALGLVQHDLPARGQHVLGPIWLRLSYNTGLSFSLARGWPFVAAIGALVALVAVTLVALRARRGWPAFGFGLIIGGGVGNLVDRLVASPHAVADYVSVGWFPSFNVADAAITVGVLTILVVALRGQTLLRPA